MNPPNVEIINPSACFVGEAPDQDTVLRQLEAVGRTCYKSEAAITSTSAYQFVRRLITLHHDAILEHVSVSIRMVCDRGVSHELVRHRIASYAQESTRYCDYKGGFVFIDPGLPAEAQEVWLYAMKDAAWAYQTLREKGIAPQMARSVLPNSLKTEIVATLNLREWRHVLNLRWKGTTGKPHPQMRQLMNIVAGLLKTNLPIIFEDIECEPT